MIIDGVEYIKKEDAMSQLSVDEELGEYVMVRTYSAGVFAGFLSKKDGDEVELINARRIYYWSGAATLSELSQSGTSDPENCKFPEEVKKITLLKVIEIIPMTKKAKKSISEVKVWKA
jgi:hypothetical protein